HLRLLEIGLLGVTAQAGRLAALLDGALGGATGWAVGWATSAMIERAQRSTCSALGSANWQFAMALAWAGVFLGWQSILPLAVADILVWLCASLAGRVWPGPRMVGPVLCLTPCTAAWILAAWFARGHSLFDRF
ncbi:MAG: hypothetical protein ACREJM_06845, partial [Candidatus Saccharimonadales bacterium]